MAPDLPPSADVVVIGAGHNALICAGYLSRAGLEVLVLEANDSPGGNTRTEELTLPGFAHDSCSSAHVLIQGNPLVRDDELGLVANFGLTYLTTDPAVVTPQPDADVLVMHRDLDGTCDEIARWSPEDATAFRVLVEEWRELAAAHGRWSSLQPPRDDAATQRYLALRRDNAWDAVHARFRHPVVRSFMLWLAMATIQDPRRSGTGFLPSSLAVGRLDFGWTTPAGGSQALPDALIRCVTAHGGRVVCGAPVTSVDVGSEGVRRVVVASGDSVAVRRAVVAGAHLATLGEMLSGTGPSPDLLRARESWRPGLSVFAVHAALRGDLTFGPSSITSAAAGYGTAGGFVRHLDRHDAGELDTDDPWLLVVNQTAVDPSRAPDGLATLKILTIAPYTLASGHDWADVKDAYSARLLEIVRGRSGGLSGTDVLAIRAESPADLSQHNAHNVGGSCHGGEFLLDGRVLPGWPRYDTDVPGLFVTGATTHPGGSVSGRPGRNCARTVLTALGLDPLTVMGPA